MKLNARRNQQLENTFNEAQKAYMEGGGETSEEFDKYGTAWVYLVMGALDGEKTIQRQLVNGATSRGEALAMILFGEPR